ncbi:transglycosylase domain-containing protein, partial [Aerococcus sp. L_4]
MKKNNEEKKKIGNGLSGTEKVMFYVNVAFKSMAKIFLLLLLILFLGGSLGIGLGSGYFIGLVEDMPIPTEEELANAVENAGEISTMTYSDDTEISSIRADLVRENTELESVSPYIINGLVATEDENFFEHDGVVPSAIIR